MVPVAVSILHTISPFLKEADRLVKADNLQGALTTIRKALDAAPGNLYVQAYEANVLSLLDKKNELKQSHPVIYDATEQLHHLAQVTIEDIGRTEQLANTLISAQDEIQQQYDEHEKKMLLSEEKINLRVGQFIQYAKDLANDKKYGNALDEIHRALIIDPLNATVVELEHEIRQAYETEILCEQAEQLRLKHEEKQLLEVFTLTKKLNPIVIDQQRADEIELLYDQAKHLAQTGEYDIAMEIILRALSVHPTHTALLELHKRVSTAVVEQNTITKELERRKYLTQKRVIEETNQTIAQLLQEAKQFLAEQQYNDAHNVLSRIEQLRPQHKEANHIRKEIQRAQLQAFDAIQTQTILPEQTVRKKQQDFVTQYSVSHSSPISAAEMSYRLQKARVYQNQCRFEDALGEIAIILVQKPKDEPALTLRNTVIEAQRQLQLTLQDQLLQAKEQAVRQKQKHEVLDGILKKVQVLREKNNYSEALDEIAKAISLDPLNEELTNREEEIRQEAKEHTQKTVEDHHLIAQHQFIETLRTAKNILLKSGFIDSADNLQTEDALRGLGKELKKKLSKKNNIRK